MTIQIPAFLQNKAYGARTDRQVLGDVTQPGVPNISSLAVTTNGATRGINIAPGSAMVPGSIVSFQGMYRLFSDAIETRTLDAAVSNPRIDQIIGRVQDSAENGNSGPDISTIEIVKGTEASGATLDNRSGAVPDGTIPKNWIRLADILVTVGVGAIPAGNIRDRRSMSRGLRSIRRLNTESTTSSSNVWSTVLTAAVEIISPQVKVSYSYGDVNVPNAPSYMAYQRIAMDGTSGPGAPISYSPGAAYKSFPAQALYYGMNMIEDVFSPSAGRHIFTSQISTDAGGVGVRAPHTLMIEEIPQGILTADQ